MGSECVWTYSDIGFDADVWESSCGESWQFIDGGPSENRARFCHGCGGRIVLSRATEEPEADDAVDPHATSTGKPSTRAKE